jgi:hypothetical protein
MTEQSLRKQKLGAGEKIPAFYGTSRLIKMLVVKQLNATIPHHAVVLTNISPILAFQGFHTKLCTVVPPHSRVIRSKTYRGYLKPRTIPNAIYNAIFV